MDYDLFWNQDCQLVKCYREAAKIRRELENQRAWLQGAYIYEAVADLAPILRYSTKGSKPKPYRAEPYPLEQEKTQGKESKSDIKAMQYMEMFMIANNERFKKKGVQNGG